MLVLAAVVVGCSVPSVEPVPIEQGDDAPASSSKSASTSKKTSGTTPVDTTSSATPESSDGTIDTTLPTKTTTGTSTPRSWSGSLGTTSTTRFGGSPFCFYDVVLTNVNVNMQLDGAGNALSASVTANMTETTPSCGSPPLGTLPIAYEFDAGDGGATGLAISVTPDSDNRPRGTLALVGTMNGTSKLHTQLEFHRTDATSDSLNWTVNAAVDLTPTPN